MGTKTQKAKMRREKSRENPMNSPVIHEVSPQVGSKARQIWVRPAADN